MGHIAKNYWAFKRQVFRSRGGEQAGRFKNQVSAVGNAVPKRQQEEEHNIAGASCYKANRIYAIPTGSHRSSLFHRMRKLCKVPGKINGTLNFKLLVDSGWPITIIRLNFWKQLRELTEAVEQEPEDFQGVTNNGLRVVNFTRLNLSLGNIQCKHPVLITKGIAYKLIIKNNFLTKYNCDILISKCQPYMSSCL